MRAESLMAAVYILAAALFLSPSYAAVDADLVDSLPGFPAASTWGFKVYSGFLNVTFDPAVAGYDGASIHYQFHTSKRNSQDDPVVAWHTGGPGGSSVYGQYSETGFFQVSESEGQAVNPFSWNNVANMLYLEAPAGSFLTPVDQHSGFSYCTKGSKKQMTCSWNDLTQAEAYGHTLLAFFKAYPEFKNNDLYLAGESYAGQYIPNIATHLLKDVPQLPLKGIAVGNGCWGGDEHTVQCNGPNEDANDVKLYHGKGLISGALFAKIEAACQFQSGQKLSDDQTIKCDLLLESMDKAVGPHNVYNVYDNCPNLDFDRSPRAWVVRSGKSLRFARRFLSRNMHNPSAYDELNALAGVELHADGSGSLGNPASGGGYDWTCGQFDALPLYFKRADVRKALHLPNDRLTGSKFEYKSSGPASVTLYPNLIKSIRVLIYNGDADTCVPYIGNEEWTTSMAAQGIVTEMKPWHPWYISNTSSSPAGYATGYSDDFQFLTVRLAGHQVPKNMPAAALTIITGFLDGRAF